jgi:hypothetical protein
MEKSNRKREIEAICDHWEGGLEEYLVSKLTGYFKDEDGDKIDLNGQEIGGSHIDIDEMDFSEDGIWDL